MGCWVLAIARMHVLLTKPIMFSNLGSMLGKLVGYGGKEAGETDEDSYVSPHGIKVHKDTYEPRKAYEKIAVKMGRVTALSTMDPSLPIEDDKVRIVCISDTHCKTKNLKLPEGDVLLHAGDFTNTGRIEEVQHFATFMAKQCHKHKVVIAGNHELSFGYYDGHCDPNSYGRLLGAQGPETIKTRMEELTISHPQQLLPDDVIYLNNSAVTVYGLKIWGSPWTPYFHNWAYNATRGNEILKVWDDIPADTDVLITHGPPIGVGDETFGGGRAGCVELRTTVAQRVKPKLHLFGHIHEGYGLYTDGTTMYANASTCTKFYLPNNHPICVDLDLPEGFTKHDVLVGT